MRFLLDENLSPLLTDLLAAAGHDAVHVRDLDLKQSRDEVILETARRETRVVISADADFSQLLATTNASQPSVVFLRRQQGRRATQIVALLTDNLDAIADDIATGAIVVIDDERIRIRSLPIQTDKISADLRQQAGGPGRGGSECSTSLADVLSDGCQSVGAGRRNGGVVPCRPWVQRSRSYRSAGSSVPRFMASTSPNRSMTTLCAGCATPSTSTRSCSSGTRI